MDGEIFRLIPLRKPAWEGSDFVGEAVFNKKLDNTSHTLISRIARKFLPSMKNILALSNYTGGLEGCFLVEGVDSTFLVLHIKSVSSKSELLIARDVTDFLTERGCNVSRYFTTIKGDVELFESDLYVTATSYLRARHTNFSDLDREKLLLAVSKLHSTLQDYKTIQPIQTKTNAFYSTLIEFVKNTNNEHLKVQAKYKHMVKESFDRVNFSYFLTGPRSITHGDLSPGNIVFDEQNEAVILDFETVSRSFKNPIFDYCMLYLRYFLDLPKETTPVSVKQFLGVLSQTCGVNISEIEFLRYMKQHIYSTVIIVNYLMANGDVFRQTEWEKLSRWHELQIKITTE